MSILRTFEVPRWLRRMIWGLTVLFFLWAMVRMWLQPNGSHTWRQSSTLAMSASFAEEARHRGPVALDFLLYPRLLDRGSGNGITACEFPLLNVLSGSLFLVFRPQAAAFLSTFLILLFNAFAAFRFLPRYLRAWGCELPGEVCLLLWFGFFRLAEQSVIFMPDGLAFPLALMGAVFLLETPNTRGGWWKGVTAMTLGLAVKPTMVVVLAAGALAPLFQKERWNRIAWVWTGFASALVFPAWWYGIHTGQIKLLSDAEQYYASATFHPLARLEEVGWRDGLRLVVDETQSGSFPVYLGGIFVVVAVAFGEWVLLGFYLSAFVLCVALDGRHSIIHRYYFMGLNAFSLVIAAKVLLKAGIRPWLRTTLVFLLVGGMLFNIRTNIWCWAHDSHEGKTNRWSLGGTASRWTPEDAEVVTDDGWAFPYKLMFIGRTGTLAGEKIYATVPSKDARVSRRVYVASAKPPEGFAASTGGIATTREIAGPLETWYLTTVDFSPTSK